MVFKALSLRTILFDEHYFAYNVQDAPFETEPIHIDYNTMQYIFPCNLITVGHGEPLKYVIVRKPL